MDATSQVPPPEPDELGIVSEHMRGAIAQRMFGAVAAGSRIGRYEVRRVVGGGAMGAVFAAFDPTLGREVALKLLIGGSADDPSQPRRADRLAREAKALARLSHPNVVAVYEVGTDDDRVYIAMEYVEGVTLREWIDAHPVGRRGELRAVVEMFQQAAAGLAAAHEVGLVHRDFKPDNALIGDDGRLRVADFGLAAWGRGAAKSDDAISGRDLEGARSSTSVGQVVGTPAYMAPEQIVGAEVGPAADQFALCVSLFEALFGRRPHTGRSLRQLAERVTSEPLALPSSPRMPARLRAVLRRGLQADPAARYRDMKALERALEGVLARRGWSLGLAATAVAALAGAGVSQALSASPVVCPPADAKVAAVASPEVTDAIAEAFAATGRPLAAQSSASVRDGLERFAAAWSDLDQQVCEATRIRRDRSVEVGDLQAACLDRRLRRVQALVDVWRHAGPEAVDRAPKLAARLAALDECAQTEQLLSVAPWPSDPTQRGAVADVHDRIDRAEAKLAGVDLDGAQAELVGVVDDAEATEHAPTLARALRTRGALEMARRDLDGAHGDLRRAFRLALGSGDDLGALQAAHGLVGYHSKVAREPDAVLVWVDLVESLATRVGGHPAHEADALDAAGLAHRELGDMPAAVAHGERAAAGWAAIDEGGPDHARTLVNLGGSYYFDGAPERGVQTLERATEMLIDALGSAHPDVAQAQQNLAAVLSITDQARAREVLTSALNAFEATYGADTGHTADVHHNLASLAFGEGDIEAARAHIKRSIAIHRAELGEDHRAVADGLIASTHYWIDEQPEVAADAAREALAIYAKALPADAPDWMQIRLRAGAAIFVGGDRPRGLALARQAIDDLDAHPGRNRIADWIDVAKYAWMLELDGQLPQALQWRARAVELLEARPEIPPGNLAAQKAAMARILWRIGEDGSRGRARTLAREARALFDEHGEDRVGQRKDLDAWLAETGALR